MAEFINKPLERRQRDHMSRQFQFVVHGSSSAIPPHRLPDENVQMWNYKTSNVHPSSFHAGTIQSAIDRASGDYLHVYEVPRESMDPIIRGDNGPPVREARKNAALSGVQTQLFEDVPLYHPEIAKNAESDNPLVLPYRNNMEDLGSLSYVIPKKMVGNGVRYLGTGWR